MKKKELYSRPSSELLELNYAEPVCQAASGNVPDYDYDPITLSSMAGMESLF